MKYTSQKAYFQEYTDGQEGVAYTLSLDNDFETLVYNSKNQLIIDLAKNPLKVVATRLINGDQASQNAGSLTVTPSDTSSWKNGTHYSFNDKNGTLTIKGVPTSFSEVKFTFAWKISNADDAVVLNKIFTLKRQNSEVGYKVEFNKSVVNGTQAGKITYKIMKINADGTRTNLEDELDGQKRIVIKGENTNTSGYDETNKEYFIKYTAGKNTPVTVSFTSIDETIIWDTETVEFVLDGATGPAGNSLMVKYINSATKPTITNNNVTGWSDTIPTVEAGKHTYMTQKMSNITNWSDPVQISAEDGTTPTIQINSNGYWVINGETSTVKAEGDTPVITVGSNGNWFINGVDSGQKAQGETGKDGSNIEYVYYRSENKQENLQAPSYTGTTLTEGWTASPQGITEVYKYEYMSVRTKPAGTNTDWSSFSPPVIWSKWGEKGQDGDGIEYKYCLTNSEVKPVYPAPNGASYVWTDEPSGVSIENKYEYVVSIVVSPIESTAKKINTADRHFSQEAWENYGKKGHEENWTIRDAENLDNSHIYLGDYAYVDGFVEGTTTPARIYGKVIELHNSSIQEGYIRMRSTHLVIGDYKTPTSTVSLWSNYSTSPYLISFDNDSATIGADKNGTVNTTTLANVSKVTTKVCFGQTDITSSCTFSWSVSGGTLNVTTGNMIYFTTMTSSTASATVTVIYKGAEIGNKTFTIAKSITGASGGPGEPGKPGDPAITYQLSVTPNEINLTTNPNGVVPNFIVTKYTGSTITNITSGYEISRSDGKTQGAAITSKTTFTLKIDGKTVDTETVEVVSDGEPGKGISSVVNYYLATTLSSGVTTSTSGWDTKVPSNFNSTNKYLWNYEITLDTDGKEVSKTTPTIIGTWGQDGKGISSIEEYYATTTSTNQPTAGDWKKVPGNPMPITDSTNKYLWNYEKINYTTGNPTTTTPAIIGTYGDTGSQGNSVVQLYVGSESYVNIDGYNFTGWDENKPDAPYVYACTATKVDTNTYENYSTPWLDSAQPPQDTSISSSQWAEFMTLTNGKSEQNLFFNNNGNMYINASLMNVGSLLVNDAFSVAINGGRKNLALEDGVSIYANPTGSPAEKIDAATCSWKLFCPIGAGTGICFPASFFADETYYTLKFYVKPIEGELTSIAGHSSCAIYQKFYINGIEQNVAFANGASVSPALGDELECIFVFKCKKGPSGSDDNLYIQPNRKSAYATACTCIISNITLYEGRGSYDNIITKINADQAGVSIAGNKINFTTSEFVIQDSSSNTLFSAYGSGVEDTSIRGTVKIGGFTVGHHPISGADYLSAGGKQYNNHATDGVYLGTDGIGCGATFSVSDTGYLKATKAKIEGNITASTGKIGLLEIDSQGSLSWSQDDDNQTPHYIYIKPNLGGIPIESSAAKINHWTINYNGIKGEKMPSGVDESDLGLGQGTNTLLITPNIVKFGLYGNPEVKARWLDIINSTNTISSGQTLDFYVSGRLSTALGTKTYKLSFVKGILVSCTPQ